MSKPKSLLEILVGAAKEITGYVYDTIDVAIYGEESEWAQRYPEAYAKAHKNPQEKSQEQAQPAKESEKAIEANALSNEQIEALASTLTALVQSGKHEQASKLIRAFSMK